jgi:3-dehydroquinate synthase
MELMVNLGEHSYKIFLENGTAVQFPEKLKSRFSGKKIALITNITLAELYSELLAKWSSELDMEIFAIPDGEIYKTIDTWKSILDFLLKSHLERSSLVIAFGGGVIGDLTGFAAASFLRGVGYIQIPTTLLAMVDSSVGGKTAVDHPLGKNLIGAFHQPKLVFADTAFLNTLSQREFLSGYAELFKYGFIGGRDMFNFVKSNHEKMLLREPQALLEGIHRSIAIKASVVEQDQFETTGLRALLNLGHTFAHSIERYFNFDAVLHGEAVFWGIKCAVELGKRIGSISKADYPIYDSLVSRVEMPVLPEKPEIQKLYQYMFSDKKVVSGKLKFIVPAEPGVSVVKGDVSEEFVLDVLGRVFM